jgi:hypothetical protein
MAPMRRRRDQPRPRSPWPVPCEEWSGCNRKSQAVAVP